MNVVFMGTPYFAVGCLEILAKKHNVVGVFTQPDKPKGRGYEMCSPPIKVRALELGFNVYQPNSVRTGETMEILRELNPDIIVVVAYGKIMPKEILDFPKYGCVNVHASLLPRHRGASPIQWSIVCGDSKTGVTTMLMDEGIDTGDMLLQKEIAIEPWETADTLHDKLAELGAQTLDETLDIIDSIKPIKQPIDGATHAPIIKKEMALIDFSKTKEEIDCAVRGFNSWPCAYFFLNGKRIKVYSVLKTEHSGNEGEIIDCEKRLIVGCKNGAVELLEVQPEGKRRMKAEDFLRGIKLQKGAII